MMCKAQNKKIYIEVLRIISAFMVMYIHSVFARSWQNGDISDINKILYMIPAIIVPAAVPIFMMISGSLLLSKDETIEDIVRNRVFRVILIILFVAILSFIQSVSCHFEYNIKAFILDFCDLEGRVTKGYWFLYWWLSFVILLPFLQKFVKRISDRDFKYLLSLCLIFNILFPIVNEILEKFFSFSLVISSSFSLFIIGSSAFYPIMGYYIDNNIEIDKIKLNKLVCIFIIVVCVVLSVLLSFCLKKTDGDEGTFTLFTPIITVLIYILIKKIFINCQNVKINSIICFLGQHTVGVYLFSWFVPQVIPITIRSILSPYLNTYVIKAILFIFHFFLLILVTAILKKIPIIKKIL